MAKRQVWDAFGALEDLVDRDAVGMLLNELEQCSEPVRQEIIDRLQKMVDEINTESDEAEENLASGGGIQIPLIRGTDLLNMLNPQPDKNHDT